MVKRIFALLLSLLFVLSSLTACGGSTAPPQETAAETEAPGVDTEAILSAGEPVQLDLNSKFNRINFHDNVCVQ